MLKVAFLMNLKGFLFSIMMYTRGGSRTAATSMMECFHLGCCSSPRSASVHSYVTPPSEVFHIPKGNTKRFGIDTFGINITF